MNSLMDYPPIVSLDLNWVDIARIPVIESGDELQILTPQQRLRCRSVYFEQQLNGATDKIYLRSSLIKRLHEVLTYLPQQYGLEVLDGWRSISTQMALREQFRSVIIGRHPEYQESEIQVALDQFVANPYRQDMVPPHLTGGSVDVTLFDVETGKTLDMGTEFDSPSHFSYSAALEQSDTQAKYWRRMLIYCMAAAGLTNLPTEWWHFDYGNQNWAFFSQSPYAIFHGIPSIDGGN